MASAGRPFRVGIVGTFDVENYGDLLFPLIAERELSQRLGDVEMVVFSYHARSTDDWPYDTVSVTELPALVPTLDALLVGGGFLIRFDHDVAPGYTAPAGVHHPTGYWLTPALLALQHNVPLVWNAPGMHCNDVPRWAQPLMRLVFGLGQHTAVRDEPTAASLRQFAPDVHVLPDTGFGLAHLAADPPTPEFAQWCEDAGIDRPYVVVQAALGSQPFVEFVRRHAAHFDGVQFIALPIGPVLGDAPALLEGLPDIVAVDAWPQPLLLAEIVRNAQAVVGHSYHLAISALVAGVPAFTPTELSDGKYTALAALQALHVVKTGEEADALDFLSKLGRGAPPHGLGRILEQLEGHWDAVAEVIRRGPTATALTVDAFWQHLPSELAATERDGQERIARLVDQLRTAESAHSNELAALQHAAADAAEGWQRIAEATSADARHAANSAAEREAELTGQVDRLQRVLLDARHRMADGLDAADGLRSSRSWRLTGPVRAISGWARRQRPTAPILRLQRVLRADMRTTPFEWAFIDELFSPADAASLAHTFPTDHFATIAAVGGEKDYRYEARSLVRFGTSDVTHAECLSPAWQRLANDLASPAYRSALGALTGRDLSDCPLEVNVSQYGRDALLGAHTDLPDKVLTQVLYFNDEWNPAHGGTLAIQSSREAADDDAIVTPLVGHSVVLVRSSHSWHAVRPVTSAAASSRRSLTAVFHQPGTTSSMWPDDATPELHDYPSSR
jgi:hypothetical protein